MVKKIIHSSQLLHKKKKKKICGSVEFQVFHFTSKIRRLTSHLELHKRDFLSQRGLRIILGKRQRLLTYLSNKNKVRYKKCNGSIKYSGTKNFLINFEFLIIILVLFYFLIIFFLVKLFFV
uniref:ribosomal protein S15 n=1 Tax=Pomatocalpa diffusum TaxID=331231 RepID=UPI0030019E0B|nr:ribosomal protein S15 [Pomatocalpa diffusum]